MRRAVRAVRAGEGSENGKGGEGNAQEDEEGGGDGGQVRIQKIGIKGYTHTHADRVWTIHRKRSSTDLSIGPFLPFRPQLSDEPTYHNMTVMTAEAEPYRAHT